jgi:hypothetical protein
MPQQTPVREREVMVRNGVDLAGEALRGSLLTTNAQPSSLGRVSLTAFVPIVDAQKMDLPAPMLSGVAGHGPFWNLAAAAIAIILMGAMTLSGWPRSDTVNSLLLQQAVAHALDETTPNSPGRLVSARLTGVGDATVEFVDRDLGDAQTNRTSALKDALAIARTLYQDPQPRLVNLTLLGLAWRPSATASYMPVLYASLPADRLVGHDWAQLKPDDLPRLAGVRWLPAGVCQAWHECEGPWGSS